MFIGTLRLTARFQFVFPFADCSVFPLA